MRGFLSVKRIIPLLFLLSISTYSSYSFAVNAPCDNPWAMARNSNSGYDGATVLLLG
jgi:hypothetical protein